MSEGQQWAVILVVFWIGSIWFTYSTAFMRGETKARNEATAVLKDLQANRLPKS